MLTKGKKVIMKYDFTSILDRNGKDAIAVEHIPIPGAQVKEGFDRIPMWVADMNFPTVPTVVEAMMERVQHPAYGYFDPSEEYYASIIRWQEKRNGVTGLKPEHIGYENGVLGGVISALNVMCSKGDNVLLHSPTYIGFTMSLENNGYHIVHSCLKKDEEGIRICAEELGVPFVTWSAEELEQVRSEDGFTESAFVRSVAGVGNVCERSALKGAGTSRLLIRKTAHNGVTVAAAVKDYTVCMED